MNLVPQAVSRKIAEQALSAQKHSPTILLGAGIACMVGSTVLACRATLKMEEVLNDIQADKEKAHRVKEVIDSGNGPEETTYTDAELKKDLAIVTTRGVVQIVKLYAPPVILGGVGILCLTKSHRILQDRNVALSAAYIAVDTAYRQYRERVVDRFGEETDRELRYESEEVDIIDEETGKITSTVTVAPGEPSGYARWFDEESSASFTVGGPRAELYNRLFLRNQQNWANDMLRSRGHVFLNEVYSMVGFNHTSAGSIVGWVYDRDNDRGDNYIDFGCWEKGSDQFNSFFNGRDGAILLDFNVDGVIWDLLDERNAKAAEEWKRNHG